MISTVIALLMGQLSPAQASPMQTRFYDVDQVSASFVLPHRRADGSWPYLVVTASRSTDQQSQVVRLSAAAGFGSCRRDGAWFYCTAGLKPQDMTAFDSNATSTTIVLKRGQTRERIEWIAASPYALVPPISTHSNHCGGTTTETYLLARNASASGRLLGRDVSTEAEYDPSAEEIRKLVRSEDCP